jgi:hypothetical protein
MSNTVEKIDGLLIEAKAFLRAGGTLSRGDWETMEEDERAAHVEAGRELALENAVLIGLASVKLESNLTGGSSSIAGIVRSLTDKAKEMEARR